MDGPVGGRVSVQPGGCVDGPFGAECLSSLGG